MSESKLRDLSMDFSVQIINLVKELKAKHESVISNQNNCGSIRRMLISTIKTIKEKSE